MARDLELILTGTGGAELVNAATGETLWASDTDEEFREEFPELLDENDAESVFDWLIEFGHLSEEEADAAGLSMEVLDSPGEAPEPVEGELVDDDDDIGEWVDV